MDPHWDLSEIRFDLMRSIIEKLDVFYKESQNKEINKFINELNDPEITVKEKNWLIEEYIRKFERDKLVKYVNNELCPKCNSMCSSLIYCTSCIRNKFKENFGKWSSGNEVIDKFIQECQMKTLFPNKIFEWVPFENLRDIKFLAEGGFGKIHTVEWINGQISNWDHITQQFQRYGTHKYILKSLKNSNLPSEEFFREAGTHYDLYARLKGLVWCFGITKHNITGEFMLILFYHNSKDLGSKLSDDPEALTWKNKLSILRRTSETLSQIHEKGFAHKDLHPGNILLHDNLNDCYVGDFGFTGPAEENSTDKIVGVIPYMAPEVLKYGLYSDKSDIYALGMIMWELITGFRPFGNVAYDLALIIRILEGERPPIIPGVPEEYTQLIIKCWDSDPSKRPTAIEIKNYCNFLLSGMYRGVLNLDELFIKLNYTQDKHPSNFYTSKAHHYQDLPEPKKSKITVLTTKGYDSQQLGVSSILDEDIDIDE
ncbi:kinase-like domain-containing protein [Gigaspora rosea]|uniref:Kinase-like domain-containing protein n=1 Tax=Gigaspora rosea TaxID=44941 RepID=A0A397U829_9GLOM|nr:kinase-like domain-containing protein [Gigaspora rosea]